jgi:hypothetical protein
MLFMPSPITSTSDPFLTHVHSDFYEKARKYVEKGGFLYASLASDGAVPEMDSLFGARIADRAISSQVTIKIVASFGALKPGDAFRYTVPTPSIQSWGVLLEVSTGKVIAVDQDGHPALVTNTIGAGRTLISAYPIEHYLASVPAAFDKPENTHTIYDAFRQWTGVKPAFHSDQPEVEVSWLNGDHRGYVIVVNHSDRSRETTLLLNVPVRSLFLVSPEGASALATQGSSAKIRLGAYEGAILEWRQ